MIEELIYKENDVDRNKTSFHSFSASC